MRDTTMGEFIEHVDRINALDDDAQRQDYALRVFGRGWAAMVTAGSLIGRDLEGETE